MGILPDNFVCPDCGFSFRLNPIQIWKVQRAKAPCPKCGSTIAIEEFGEIHGRLIGRAVPYMIGAGAMLILLRFCT